MVTLILHHGVGFTVFKCLSFISLGHLMSMTPEQLQAWRWEREIDERNRPLTDEELDAMFPEGYKVSFPSLNCI